MQATKSTAKTGRPENPQSPFSEGVRLDCIEEDDITRRNRYLSWRRKRQKSYNRKSRYQDMLRGKAKAREMNEPQSNWPIYSRDRNRDYHTFTKGNILRHLHKTPAPRKPTPPVNIDEVELDPEATLLLTFPSNK